MTLQMITDFFEDMKKNETPSEFHYRPCICPYNIPAKNPHVKQFEHSKQEATFNPWIFSNPFRILRPETPRREYRRRQNENISVSVNPDKRILLMWLEFLVNHKPAVVVFNQCFHVRLANHLASLFPVTNFHIYGTQQDECKNNVHFYEQILTSNTVLPELGDFALIYCNDDRASRGLSIDESNETSLSNMEKQKRIVEAIRPKVFLLPFSLPWSNQTISFFNGDLFIPPHGQRSETELALVSSDCDTIKEYNSKEIEEEMFYFNTELRGTLYHHHLTVGMDGRFFRTLDCCFDCTSELYILCQYFHRIKGIDPYSEVYDLNEMQNVIEQLCRQRQNEEREDVKYPK